MKTVNKDVYLVFRTFATGHTHHDTLFGIAFAVVDSLGTFYCSSTLSCPIMNLSVFSPSSSSSSYEPPQNTSYTLTEWTALWKSNHWSMDYFNYTWHSSIGMLNDLHKSANCSNSTELLSRFVKECIEVVLSVTPKGRAPIVMDVGYTWNFLCARLASSTPTVIQFLNAASALEFHTFAQGISRSYDHKDCNHYDHFFKALVYPRVKQDFDETVQKVVPEVAVYVQHTLYLDAYLKQDDISQIIQPTKSFMISILLVGFLLGLIIAPIIF